MNYFIGYLIRGSAAEWHIKLSDEIAEKFRIWKISEKNPPHITIYYPFKTEDIGSVKDFLRQWINSHRLSGNVAMSGFDRFDNRVIFAAVNIDHSVEQNIQELRRELENILPSKDTILPDQVAWHAHATLAYKIPEEKINEIWNYLQTLKAPTFEMPFDNISIFKWENNKWIVEESLSC